LEPLRDMEFPTILPSTSLDTLTGAIDIPKSGFYLISINGLVNGTLNQDIEGFEIDITSNGVTQTTSIYSIK
jgi:hypothetical protein